MSPIKLRSVPRATSTYTLRLGSSEFPFLETLPQSVTDSADVLHTSVSPSTTDLAQSAPPLSSAEVNGSHSNTNISRCNHLAQSHSSWFMFLFAGLDLASLPFSYLQSDV